MDDLVKTREELLEELTRHHVARMRMRSVGQETLREVTWIEWLLRGASVPLLWCDRDESVRLMSRGAERLFGCAELDYAGQPLAALVPPPERFEGSAGRFLQSLAEVTADGEAPILKVVACDGRPLKLEAAISAISPAELLLAPSQEPPASSGVDFGFLVFFRDIGAQIARQSELKQRLRAAEQRVAELGRAPERPPSGASGGETHAERLQTLALMLRELRIPMKSLADYAESALQAMAEKDKRLAEAYLARIHQSAMGQLALLADMLEATRNDLRG